MAYFMRGQGPNPWSGNSRETHRVWPPARTSGARGGTRRGLGRGGRTRGHACQQAGRHKRDRSQL